MEMWIVKFGVEAPIAKCTCKGEPVWPCQPLTSLLVPQQSRIESVPTMVHCGENPTQCHMPTPNPWFHDFSQGDIGNQQVVENEEAQ
jgi:hypothetical protein